MSKIKISICCGGGFLSNVKNEAMIKFYLFALVKEKVTILMLLRVVLIQGLKWNGF